MQSSICTVKYPSISNSWSKFENGNFPSSKNFLIEELTMYGTVTSSISLFLNIRHYNNIQLLYLEIQQPFFHSQCKVELQDLNLIKIELVQDILSLEIDNFLFYMDAPLIVYNQTSYFLRSSTIIPIYLILLRQQLILNNQYYLDKRILLLTQEQC